MRYYSILPNYHLAVQLALKHLRINGHQLIAYLGSVNTFGDHKELTMDPRFYYYRASQANRDSYDPSLVLDCEMNAKAAMPLCGTFWKRMAGRPKRCLLPATPLHQEP